jgi:hypothetical protein
MVMYLNSALTAKPTSLNLGKSKFLNSNTTLSSLSSIY